jgi:hypothetical protein
MYLRRYHEIAISQSGMWRILKRLIQFVDYVISRLPSRSRRSRPTTAFESGVETAAVVAAGSATDVGVDAALGAGVDVLDRGAALAPPVDAAAGGGGTPFVFDNHPISATLRSAG